ncbi:MAG TPA: DNA methyltransferase [Candidatus Sumerlaeota bacterium]|nr:DNA methyltransferase [Candidatus Sumerlaeota bacterium]
MRGNERRFKNPGDSETAREWGTVGAMLTNDWKRKPKTWGHPLHTMCPYPGMFPPRLPHYFIQKFTRPGDVVFDPFSGRGTTALQACLEGRVGIGSDRNPLAGCLTTAKVNPPDPVDLRNRIDDLSNDMFFAPVGQEPEYIQRLFHERTMSQLVFLKQELDPQDRTDAFILAVLLGLVQNGGTTPKNSEKSETGLSIPIPKSACLSPDHILAYANENRLQAPEVDVFTRLRSRIDQLTRQGLPRCRGRAWAARVQDIRTLPEPALKNRQVQLVVTAPPSLKAQHYGQQNWVRLWFLDEDAEQLDQRLDRYRKLERYLDFMAETCRTLYAVLRPGGICALVFGDVQKRGQEPVRLAEAVWARLEARHTRFQLATIIEDTPGRSPSSDTSERSPLRDRVLVLYKGEYSEHQERVAW